MMHFKNLGLSAVGETYILELYKRIENSPYEWENRPAIEFRGRPANTMEKKLYRLMEGVMGNEDSIFVVSTRMPEDVKVKDKVRFLGKEWTVASVGFYFDEARFINAGVMSDEYIMSRCPKGITLQ